ncbi:hypothetical protein BJX63DRAFT_435113 [Aspergillus granulosus]|uniref:Uncharacterized protein n=1 Tax=Aspergillus granulosus TaxID=176169 RepID=A0ABR4H278_9EURO
MPSLYKLIDAMSDLVVSVVSSNPGSSHREPSTPGKSELKNNESRSYNNHIKYNDKDYDQYPTHHHRLPYPPAKRRPTIPYSKTRVRGTNSEYLAPKRFTKPPSATKSVHWSNMMEVDGDPYRFTAPALNSYPLRRRRKANYVYGADGGDSNNNVHNTEGAGHSRSSTPVPQEPDNDTSYEEQRYPVNWYSCSRSGSRNPSPVGSYPGSDQDSSRTWSPSSNKGSSSYTSFPAYTPRSILKPPTATDDEMLLRNTWSIIARQEQQINYMYDFLSDVLLVGHDVLDCMFETGEISMWEETTRHAQQAQKARMRQGFEARERGSRGPIPGLQHSHDHSPGQTQYPVSNPGHSPTLGSNPPPAFEELERRKVRKCTSGEFSLRGSLLDPRLNSQRSPVSEDSREASPVQTGRPSSSPQFDSRPDSSYGREGAMSRQEKSWPPGLGFRDMDTIYEDPEDDCSI